MTLLILVVVVGILAIVAFRRGGTELVATGATEGLALLVSVLPQLLIGFLLAGFMTVVLPTGVLGRWVGEDSGIGGVVIATVAGALTPGGPFVQFPLVAALVKAGAAPGPMAAYLTAWSLLGLQRLLIWEIPILGSTFALSRWLVSVPVAIVAGLLVPPVLRALTSR